MPSQVDIINLGLNYMGSTRILSVTDNEKAEKCGKLWQPVVDGVLQDNRWYCADHRATLAALSATPAFGYSYQFQLPTNPYCLKPIEANQNLYDWKREGRLLLTDQDEVELLYTKRIVDCNQFDPLLVKVIYQTLAAELAVALKQETRLSLEIYEIIEKVTKPAAKAANAMGIHIGADGSATQRKTTRTVKWDEAGR